MNIKRLKYKKEKKDYLEIVTQSNDFQVPWSTVEPVASTSFFNPDEIGDFDVPSDLIHSPIDTVGALETSHDLPHISPYPIRD